MGEMEKRLADIIWENQPISSRALCERCAQVFDWKRTTTYTMLKRLCERKLFENQSGTVVSLMSKEEFLAAQGELFLNETFAGSLPHFLAAFTRRKKLSESEIAEIQRLIDRHQEV